MRAVVPILAIAAAPAATVGLASCAQPIVPLETMSVRAVAPGRSVRGASLFGTDVVGLPMGTLLTPDAAPGARLLSLISQARQGSSPEGLSRRRCRPTGRRFSC